MRQILGTQSKPQRPLSDEQIDAALAGKLCRCGTYQRIRAGVHAAAKSLAKTGN